MAVPDACRLRLRHAEEELGHAQESMADAASTPYGGRGRPIDEEGRSVGGQSHTPLDLRSLAGPGSIVGTPLAPASEAWGHTDADTFSVASTSRLHGGCEG